jgi:hypothetical protein
MLSTNWLLNDDEKHVNEYHVKNLMELVEIMNSSKHKERRQINELTSFIATASFVLKFYPVEINSRFYQELFSLTIIDVTESACSKLPRQLILLTYSYFHKTIYFY